MPVNWRIRQDSHLQTLRSKRRMIVISPRMRNGSPGRSSASEGWWVTSDLHPVAVRQYFSPVKGRDFTIKVCNPEKSDTKAELNRRSQACDGPDRHRCSHRVKWSAVLAHGHRVTLPHQLACKASALLVCHDPMKTGTPPWCCPKQTEFWRLCSASWRSA